VRTVRAIRYLTPLREGGSVPAIVEADDDGTYVAKFCGAAQGPRALVAELIAGEIGRLLGLPVPQLVLIEFDALLARSEPDEEIQELLRKSAGLNLALDYLPGALNWEPALAPPPDPALAAAVVWFDAFVTNVDRTAKNPNMLRWHRRLYLIDHGAALYFHHDWPRAGPIDAGPLQGEPREHHAARAPLGGTDHLAKSRTPFAMIRHHALLPLAGDLRAADAALAPRITEAALREIVAQVPDAWLTGEVTPEVMRQRYVEHLWSRVAAPRAFVEEAIRGQLV
jgi:HipA-like protein